MTRQEMREAIRPLMSEERYRHSLGVEKEAERLARRWGEDPEKAAIAGILHDCCKEMPLPEALQIMRRSAIMTEIDFREQPQLIHGFAAAEILGRYGVRDKDIENAVRYHTTGRAGMSRLEKIVYLADLTEEGRHYPDEPRCAAGPIAPWMGRCCTRCAIPSASCAAGKAPSAGKAGRPTMNM